MTSFDYLPKRFSLRNLLYGFRLPRMGLPVNALICSCIVVSASWAIEANRLNDSLAIERSYSDRYETQMQMLTKANVYSEKIRTLMNLDRRVRLIVGSGTLTARRLAGIAGDLPQNVWLTSVAPDDAGVVIEGRAPSFSAVSLALRRLSGDRAVGDPALTSAQVENGAVPEIAVRFVMHIADRTVENVHAAP